MKEDLIKKRLGRSQFLKMEEDFRKPNAKLIKDKNNDCGTAPGNLVCKKKGTKPNYTATTTMHFLAKKEADFCMQPDSKAN